MKKNAAYLMLLSSLLGSSCAVKLTSAVNKTSEEIDAIYRVLQDVSYGPDKEQRLDIYLSEEAGKRRGKNFTLVFLHGGGYYVSDKANEVKYIRPYLKKGMNVINVNYRLKRGIPMATADLTHALNFLEANKAAYPLNLNRVVLAGFSSGAHIASNIGVSANNPDYPYALNKGIKIAGIINFSGPVDGLDVVEKVFMGNEQPIMKEIGRALFPASTGFAPKDTVTKYAPITYFDKEDPPFFLWYGGKDNQILPATFERFVALLNKDKAKNGVLFSPEGLHSPNSTELERAFEAVFVFLDTL